ncbi:MAG TPA: spermidine/putrescine ABC transporter permease [Clostridiales bacterium]|nr:spermidine/putrescine ABC transporter permease [Clostridiales bacterium]
MSKWLKRIYVFGIFIFLYAPILILIIFSFNDSRSRVKWEGFSLHWYSELFRDTELMSALYTTLSVGILSALAATVIGTAAAIGIRNMRRIPRAVVLNVTYIPVLNPDIVTGVALMLLFVVIRLEMGYVTLLLSHITFNIPYVIFSVLPKLRQLDRYLYEAAMDLGARPFQAFRKAVLPEIMPGVVAALLLTFTLSIDDFVISFFTTGSSVQNLATVIYSMARRGINPKINVLSTLLFTTVMSLLLLLNLKDTGSGAVAVEGGARPVSRGNGQDRHG